MFDYSKCDTCVHTPGYGSEVCGAQWGDYCPAGQHYVTICYAEWIQMTEEDKIYWKEFFQKIGIDIPYDMCYNTYRK